MSVVVAIKEDDTIYLGADTLMTMGSTKIPEINNEEKYKLTKFKNGVILAHTGGVATTQKLVFHEEWFDKVPEKGLDKEFILNEIVPKLKKELEEYKLLVEDGSMDATFFIAYKDKLYDLKAGFTSVRITEYASIGAGKDFALSSLSKEYLSLEERIVSALRTAAKMCSTVSGPFVLIDTKNLEFIIKG